MFDKIINTPVLFGIMFYTCSENNAAVEFDNSLLINNDLNHDKVLILKPDELYHPRYMGNNTPPAPDCLILVRCIESDSYALYLIELKDTNHKGLVNYDDIVKKFETMINRFFHDFADIFSTINYKKIEFYLVTTFLTRKNRSLILDNYMRKPKLPLFDKKILIIPVPSPFKITAC
jgi:hypothetical protein